MRRVLGWAGTALALAALAGCASRQVGAPVTERGSARPASAPKGPAAQPTPVPGASTAPEGFYQVKRGDTLYSIALEHGADYREMAQWNYLDDPTKIRVGQLLRVKPPEERPTVQAAPARGAGRVESKPLESRPIDAKQPETKLTESRPAELKPASPAAIELIWPVKGKVITGFPESKNKGIDIGGNIGEPVLAAAPGKVIYVGTGIPGYGKFVVIKHGEMSTVYAHNKAILVKLDDSVARGQKIAELGDTDADRPKLHFQLRRLGNPLDPLRYLPAS